MVDSKEPLKIHDVYVGSYDAISCPVCRYYYLTERDYDLALNDAWSLGLIGLPVHELIVGVSLEEINFGSPWRVTSSNIRVPSIEEKEQRGIESNLNEPPTVHIPRQTVQLSLLN